LARERHDIQEQLEWREQIPALLKPLKRVGAFHVDVGEG
jgi:hypothetical protein